MFLDSFIIKLREKILVKSIHSEKIKKKPLFIIAKLVKRLKKDEKLAL